MRCNALTSTAMFIALMMIPLSSVIAQRPARADLSPEGQAVLKDFYNNPDHNLSKCLQDRKKMESQLIEEGQKPDFDWTAAKSLLKKSIVLQEDCSRRAQLQFIDLMDRLPGPDRVAFYRDLYHPIRYPILVPPPAARSPE